MNITEQVSHLLGILGLRTIYILGLGLGLDNKILSVPFFI